MHAYEKSKILRSQDKTPRKRNPVSEIHCPERPVIPSGGGGWLLLQPWSCDRAAVHTHVQQGLGSWPRVGGGGGGPGSPPAAPTGRGRSLLAGAVPVLARQVRVETIPVSQFCHLFHAYWLEFFKSLSASSEPQEDSESRSLWLELLAFRLLVP